MQYLEHTSTKKLIFNVTRYPVINSFGNPTCKMSIPWYLPTFLTSVHAPVPLTCPRNSGLLYAKPDLTSGPLYKWLPFPLPLLSAPCTARSSSVLQVTAQGSLQKSHFWSCYPKRTLSPSLPSELFIIASCSSSFVRWMCIYFSSACLHFVFRF